MKEKISIYWSRRDFRLKDNKALTCAVQSAKKQSIPLLPLFILEDYMIQGKPEYQFGFPSRFFLSQALPQFAINFKEFLITQDKSVHFFKKLSHLYTIEIHVNVDVHPDFYTQIKKIRDTGIDIKLYKDQMSVHKETKTSTGNYYSVFTPFKNAVWKEFVTQKEDTVPSFSDISFFSPEMISSVTILEHDSNILLDVFSKKQSILVNTKKIDLEQLHLLEQDFDLPYTNEKQALSTFELYVKNEMSLYKEKRDSLELDTTSRMSLALTWGLVSARTLKTIIQKKYATSFENREINPIYEGPIHFISELIWREFYKYLFFHNPKLLNEEFQIKYRTMKWLPEKEALTRFKAWIEGKTGYPIVDAAMMQLAKSGLMHNRSRMIVASVLTKNLGVDWRWGQEYFRAMLLDLDEASNNGGWQWGASVGADPKPIRIFNPYLQAENYDKNNVYQNKWLTDEYKKNPPKVLVEHKDAREQALERYGLSHKGVRDY